MRDDNDRINDRINIIDDLSSLTTIAEKHLVKLLAKEIYCISDAVAEAKAIEKDAVDLDIGIGTLSIRMSEEEVAYKFIPSAELHSAVKSAISSGQNLLEDKLEASLVSKVTDAYKELL